LFGKYMKLTTHM